MKQTKLNILIVLCLQMMTGLTLLSCSTDDGKAAGDLSESNDVHFCFLSNVTVKKTWLISSVVSGIAKYSYCQW